MFGPTTDPCGTPNTYQHLFYPSIATVSGSLAAQHPMPTCRLVHVLGLCLYLPPQSRSLMGGFL